MIVATKSVRPPVDTLSLPAISALAVSSLMRPLKSSLPLSTFRPKAASWPPGLASLMLTSSVSGTPFTVAVPAIESGPWREPTDAVASTFSAFSVWPVCGLVKLSVP